MRTLKLLVYGDVNLNIMDGSSVWLAELLRLLASDPRVELDFLHKAPNQGGALSEQVRGIPCLNRIEIHPLPMTPDQVVGAIRSLDAKNHYDRVFVRGNIAMGKELITYLSGRLAYYTLEPFQRLREFTTAEKAEIGELLNKMAFAVVQSERMRTSYSREFGIPKEHLYILPPLIPPILKNPSFRNRMNSLCYTGKFSEEWGTIGLVDAFNRLKELLPCAKLNVAGNKYHGELGGRKEEIERFFTNDESVNWVGVVSRKESIQLSRDSDIGFALRSNLIDNDNSQELSTKLFEYMSAGKPVILRATKVHRDLMGEDYPLFAETAEQAAEKCAKVLTNVALYTLAAKMSYDAYKRFAKTVNHGEIVERLLEFQKTTILFVGHDLKFISDIIESFQADENYEILIDQWKSHTQHDEQQSFEKLEKADIIFCEWGLGNIRWYSKFKKPGQKLLVRVHRQEVQRLDYLCDSVEVNIDNYIFIAPYRYEEFVEKVDIPRHKAKMIFNAVNTDIITKKDRSSDGYTLGLVGIVPWGKRLDRAVGIIEKLWKKNKRYKLRIKGKRPEELPWMFNKQHCKEMKEYGELFQKIENSPWRNNVIFDPHGNDMPEWYKKIDYILSVSDYEGSHQAVAEGMAAGVLPLILPWVGSDTVYPNGFHFTSEMELVDFLIKRKRKSFDVEYVEKHFSLTSIEGRLKSLMRGRFL
jgi:glycosyltransferase involved in cell wall biosynthesis